MVLLACLAFACKTHIFYHTWVRDDAVTMQLDNMAAVCRFGQGLLYQSAADTSIKWL